MSRPPVQCKECKELFPDKNRQENTVVSQATVRVPVTTATSAALLASGKNIEIMYRRRDIHGESSTCRALLVGNTSPLSTNWQYTVIPRNSNHHLERMNALCVERKRPLARRTWNAWTIRSAAPTASDNSRPARRLQSSQHVKESSPCPTCNICTFRGRLAKHWLISMNHPKCYDCKLGFEDMSRWSQHKAICPTSLSLRSSKASRSEMKSDTGTAEASTPSVRFGADDPSTTVHDTASGPEADALSWHCRLCTGEVCIEPVVTVCGHIFCHRCIVQELGENMRCPVCKKAFFIRLHTRN